ncbi:hypothetical protein BDV40DRAFT_294358 [Aspergillus tamarii]|uniref:Uncharacterized protein n=1 Tax=Aspergillus tamarii TaxID=41984 RepID=A0A5N6VBK2_ASPTM|nr:hypothetical protein BDV40DRAFT_294358 [Aspergillus tamarii]
MDTKLSVDEEGGSSIVDTGETVSHQLWQALKTSSDIQVGDVTLANSGILVKSPVNVHSTRVIAAADISETPPEEYVLVGDLSLFGVMDVELYSLQSADILGTCHRVILKEELSMGRLIPSMKDSPFDIIKLSNTTLTYITFPTEDFDYAELNLSTSIQLSGVLQPINAFLRDIFHQDQPHLDVSALISSNEGALNEIPTPVGFILRGELPDINVTLFEVLSINGLGVDIIGTRSSSTGPYAYSYGFFGQGYIGAVAVNWYIKMDHSLYYITIFLEGDESWKNVDKLPGLTLDNVLFGASWKGTDISSIALEMQSTFSFGTFSLLLNGSYGKDSFDISGTLEDCSLVTLKEVYEKLFDESVNIDIPHDISFSTLFFRISRDTGVTIHGKVTINQEHTVASATISFQRGKIHISGGVSAFTITDDIFLESPAIALTIGKEACQLQFSGHIKIQETVFGVSVYVERTPSHRFEYTAYGSFEGKMYLADICPQVKGEFLDLALDKVAVCVSNMESPQIGIKENLLAYPIKKGLQIYAQFTPIDAVKSILPLDERKPLTISASYQPGTGTVVSGSSFEVAILLPDFDLAICDCIRSGPLAMGLRISSDPAVYLTADAYLTVPDQNMPLKLELEISVGAVHAQGSLGMVGTWKNPFNLCKDLSVHKLLGGLDGNYIATMSTGVPPTIIFQGDFEIQKFRGQLAMYLGAQSKDQLISLQLDNLDLSGLVEAVSHFMDADIPIQSRTDILYIEHLFVYLSTGVEVKRKHYPPGVMIDAKMTILGKKAVLQAAVSQKHALLAGTIDSFYLGDMQVCGTGGHETNPYVNFELSREIQKLFMDGMIMVNSERCVAIKIEADPHKDVFRFFFDLVFEEALRITVLATLDEAIPATIQTARGRDVPRIIQCDGGQLQGKNFNVFAKMEQHLLEYINRLVNEHFEREGDPKREEVLRLEYNTAQQIFLEADRAYEIRKQAFDNHINAVSKKYDDEARAIKEKKGKAQIQLEEYSPKRKQVRIKLALHITREQEKLKFDENKNVVSANGQVSKVTEELEQCKSKWQVLQPIKSAVDIARQKRDSEEETFTQVQVELLHHDNKEPKTDDATNPAWEWIREDILSRVKQQEAVVSQARTAYAAALAEFDQEEYHSVRDSLAPLERKVSEARERSQKQLQAMQKSIDQAQRNGESRLKQFDLETNRHYEALGFTIKSIETEETDLEDARKRAIQEVEKNHDSKDSEEYRKLSQAKAAMTAASTKYHSFDRLVHVLNVAGDIYTTPLRWILKNVGGQFVDISTITILGQWGRVSQQLKAEVKCKIGLVEQNLTLFFNFADVINFFEALWNAICSFLPDLGKQLSKGFQDGLDDAGRFLDDAGRTLEQGANDVKDAIEDGLNNIGDAIGGLFG